ncbi:DUF2808 domain-containing protein [Leptolyngbya boryana CZ1]|uniref:DUF2808 domain-containing protein n=1 Tax=Leptolyngbya boryana CZ1 TaxID=3060204 RepID=A0AA96WT53_LEPBY|nr:DUF2808 domain-containing protein [Leptolyngbya boryana]WNZ43799.1 DUF2808 domain-containing protein [Leptolyngbya boryana CZ1]
MITKSGTKIITIALLSFFLIVASTSAIEVSGKTYFERPPRLMGAATSQNGTYIWGATYYFTVNVPEEAGVPLQRLEIELQASPGRPFFTANNLQAFEGRRKKPGDKISLKDVKIDPQTQMVSVTFDPPIKPDKTITLRIYPVQNPNTGGTYLYGITAFPEGSQPVGQFLGFGRIRIYDREQD